MPREQAGHIGNAANVLVAVALGESEVAVQMLAEIVGVEQNPNTKSRWAELARSGKKVMQFMQDNRYFAVVADGKCILYGSAAAKK